MNAKNFLILSGYPKPAGATVDKKGVNFSIFSQNATKVAIHFFENIDDEKPAISYELDPKKNKTGAFWHIFIEGAKKGDLYLYTADGPFNPDEGLCFNKNNFLLDPYAKQLTNHSVFNSKQTDQNIEKNEPTAKNFPKCIVIDDDEFDWENDKPLNFSLRNCIIYEAHTKGLTVLNSGIGKNERGSYTGLIEVIPYLKELGITSLELLPLFEFDENENININPFTGKKLKNYWGYSTIAFFSPKASFASQPDNAVNEFKTMVKEFHKANLEIILDVVFNHTAEGNENGAVFSFKGLDNSIYYHLEENKKYYKNYSGCGNTVNADNSITRNFILDCLRYWVLEMHIDGFRFDLASILARNANGEIDLNAPLLRDISEDPILKNTKIIAEPWDGAGGYMVGKFPGRWAEWNDLYRDTVKKFWLQPNPDIRHLATRLTGSSDLYENHNRKPYQSINYICCHDGFTLYDLLSYNNKHNEENGENNRDGSNSNFSFNHGAEGCASDKIEQERKKTAKNILLTLLISVGTPMMNMGDEVLRSQNGNNNTYCQDNELSWFDWALLDKNAEFLDFTKKLINFRKKHFSFIRKRFFTGITDAYNKPVDLLWFDNNAQTPDWSFPSQFLAVLINGDKSNLDTEEDDNDFFVIFNSYSHDITVKLPDTPIKGKNWYRLIDTSYPAGSEFLDETEAEILKNQNVYISVENSLSILISF